MTKGDNMKIDSWSAAIGLILGFISLSVIVSMTTIFSINVLFGTSIPIEFESIAAMSWLSFIVGAIVKDVRGK